MWTARFSRDWLFRTERIYKGVKEGKVLVKKGTPKLIDPLMRALPHGRLRSWLTRAPIGLSDTEFKLDEVFKVSHFKLGRKESVGEREAQEIQYALSFQGTKEPLMVSVWLDAEDQPAAEAHHDHESG